MAKKYIDADKLIHDLEERIFAYSEGYAGGDDYRKDAIETLLKDVRYQCSLQQEQQEVDLEKEIKDICRGYRINESHEQELGKQDIENIVRCSFNLGLKARKEENK